MESLSLEELEEERVNISIIQRLATHVTCFLLADHRFIRLRTNPNAFGSVVVVVLA